MASGTSSSTTIVDQLLEQVMVQPEQRQEEDEGQQQRERIDDLIGQLSSTSSSDSSTTTTPDFDSLIGYYNVSYTLTTRPDDNPVGGKWTRSQRLWKIRRTLQHILPLAVENDDNNNNSTNPLAVAQVINVVILDCLWCLLPIFIVLRGDAVPLSQDDPNKQEESKTKKLLPDLSPITVRAYFDRPRIALGKRLVFSLGPTSSVVLDTPYIDHRIRIGKGGTSGSKFVFARILDENGDEGATQSWKWLLERKVQSSLITKRKASWGMAALAVTSSIIGFGRMPNVVGVWKWMAKASTILSCLSLGWMLSSTGGIETRGETFTPGK
jgi:hypothetical protein